MFFNWRGIKIVLIVIAVVLALCAIDVSCSSKTEDNATLMRVKDELAAGKKEVKNLRAEELERLARDMRVMSKKYLEKGEKKKAQRAIGAALELERKIQSLRNEK